LQSRQFVTVVARRQIIHSVSGVLIIQRTIMT
jgi:hypothetical protein